MDNGLNNASEVLDTVLGGHSAEIRKFLYQVLKIKLWLLNDSHWYAAENADSAIAQYRKDQETEDDVEAVLVSDEDLDGLSIIEEEPNEGEDLVQVEYSFRKYLYILIIKETQFPYAFAHNE